MNGWISVKDRLPDAEGEYLTAWRGKHTGNWQYIMDEWGDGDDETPSHWYSDSANAPKVEYWLDFPRLPEAGCGDTACPRTAA